MLVIPLVGGGKEIEVADGIDSFFGGFLVDKPRNQSGAQPLAAA
jgi:hypothetical protein